MKTFTLKLASLVLAFLASSMSYAVSIEQDFTGDWTPAIPTIAADSYTEHTSPSGAKFGLYSAKLNTFGGASNLYLTKKKGYIVLPVTNFTVGNIEITCGTGSVSTTAELSLYSGTVNGENIVWSSEPIETKVVGAAETVSTFTLTQPTAGQVYKLAAAATIDKNVQLKSIKINAIPSVPTISFTDNNDLIFGTGLNGSQTKTVGVVGSNLTDAINVTIEGEASSYFSVDKNTLEVTGGSITVTYTGSKAGTVSSVLKVKSGTLTQSLNMTATTIERAGTKNNPFTVKDVIKLNNTTTGDFWVKGTIAGCAITASESNPDGIDTKTTASNITLKEEGASTTVPVALVANTDARTNLNLVDNASNLNKEVLVYGNLELYFTRAGMKGTSDYVLDPATGIISDFFDALRVFVQSGIIHIQGAQDDQNVEVYDMSGRSVVKTTVKSVRSTGINGLRNQSMYLVKVGNKVNKVALY